MNLKEPEKMPRHMALDSNEHGYDIQSNLDKDSNEKIFIEVKTSMKNNKQSKNISFKK